MCSSLWADHNKFWFDSVTFKRIPILINLCFLILVACGLDVEDPTPPAAPIWVAKSGTEEWPETGIDAVEDGGIRLEWLLDKHDRGVSISIFRAHQHNPVDSTVNWEQLRKFEDTNPPVTWFVDRSVQIGTVYYYKLLAEDAAGNQSEYSPTINYSLLMPIFSESMVPNGLDVPLPGNREVRWRYPTALQMEVYIVTILNEFDELLVRRELQPGNYIGTWESWEIPEEVLLVPGNRYFWRIDAASDFSGAHEGAGSESLWAKFVVE